MARTTSAKQVAFSLQYVWPINAIKMLWQVGCQLQEQHQNLYCELLEHHYHIMRFRT